jgi:hypothetical protein
MEHTSKCMRQEKTNVKGKEGDKLWKKGLA